MECVQKLNMFPVKGGISAYYSPRTLLGLPPLDYDKNCSIPFGAYVQANQDNSPTNTAAPRIVDAIYLRATTGYQGGHELFTLHTQQVITRSRAVEIPATDHIIRRVQLMATSQGIHSLKFTDKKNQPFQDADADWIAGVDGQLDPNRWAVGPTRRSCRRRTGRSSDEEADNETDDEEMDPEAMDNYLNVDPIGPEPPVDTEEEDEGNESDDDEDNEHEHEDGDEVESVKDLVGGPSREAGREFDNPSREV